jgi:choice-of-anchor B domain-containing protein
LIFIILLMSSFGLFAQTPCENGMAGDYPCKDVDLMAHLAPQELGAEAHEGFYLNDIWGWTDPDTGREYALVGMTNGTSFVDVTDPINPIVLGMLPEHEAAVAAGGRTDHDGVGQEAKSIWRDIKTFQHYAFIVSEDAVHGMQVFDLHQLRDWSGSFTEYDESAHYDGVGNAHNIVINEETGFAYAVGATKGNSCLGASLHVIDINDPLNPTYAGCFDREDDENPNRAYDYTHDAQVVVYNGPDTDYQGKEIAFNSNEYTVTIVDITDKSNMTLVSRSPYSGSAYTHQGWLTEDHRYFICNDELAEYKGGKGSVQFPFDKPLPVELIKKIISFRKQENEEKYGKKKSR